MANVKISALNSAITPLDGTETIPIVQGGETKKVAVSDVSGLRGVHTLRPLKSGQYTSNLINTGSPATITGAVDRIVLTPYIPATEVNSQNLSIFVQSNASPSTLCRILVYSDNNGYAKDKIFESANLDLSTTGIKTVLASITFEVGKWYWLGIITNYTLFPAISAAGAGQVLNTYQLSGTAGMAYAVQGYTSTYSNPTPDTLIEASITQPNVPPPVVLIQNV